MTKEELRQYRISLGLSCKEAGEIMHLTKQAISSVENGKNTKKSTMLFMELAYRDIESKQNAWLERGLSLEPEPDDY